MNGACDVRLAHPEDLAALVSILEDVALWASLHDLAAWEPGLFSDADGVGQEWVRTDVKNGTAYLIWSDDVAVGTFALRARDELFWPHAPDDALYLHRFAVRRAAAGIGRQAINWMIEEARRQGRRYVRLDCHARNQRIRTYYVAAGFTHRGDVVIDGKPYSLYEVRVDRRRFEPSTEI